MKLFFIILGIVILAIALLICIPKAAFTLAHAKMGDLPQAVTAKLLKKFAGIRQFKVISNIDLPMSDGRVAHVENLLIGFFGIIITKSEGAKGIVYGDYKSAQWTAVKGKEDEGKTQKASFPNPVPSLEEALDAVRSTLTSHKVYKTSLEHYVVFTKNSVNLAVAKGLPVMKLKELKKLLRKEKYSANGPVDVDDVYSVLISAAVK